MPKDKTAPKVLKTVKKAAGKGGVLDQLTSKLNSKEKQQLQKAFKALDQEFIAEKANLLKDTISEILLHRAETPNLLLQRNAWATLDAIALHWDGTGFTRAFQAAAPKMFRDVRLDDPKIVALEYGLLSDVMGGEAELSRLGLLSFPEIEEVIKYAEKHRADGFRDIARKGFNFQQAFANSCGRHDNMLEVMIHSPQAAKVIAQFALVIVNAIAAGLALVLAETLFGFLIGAAVCIMTIVIVCILGKGC